MGGMNSCSRRVWIGALAVAIVWIPGCGKTGRPKTIPISGRVTIDGQPPGENGRLHFTPTHVAEGYSKRPASGAFGFDGSYRVMSWVVDDGLVPGRYSVAVRPGDPAKSVIPARYQENATSGLEVDVPVDKSTIEFDIPIVTK